MTVPASRRFPPGYRKGVGEYVTMREFTRHGEGMAIFFFKLSWRPNSYDKWLQTAPVRPQVRGRRENMLIVKVLMHQSQRGR